MGLIDPALLWAAAIGLLSGVVHGYSGFGGGLLMVPLLSLLLSPVEAVAASTIAAVMGQLPVVRQGIQHARWSECLPFLVGLAVAMPAGVYLLTRGNVEVVRHLVGSATLLAAIILTFGWAYRGTRTPLVSGLFGMLSGFLGGATGQGGPPAVVYFLAAPMEARQQRASIIAAVTGLVGITLVVLAAGGALTSRTAAFGLAVGLTYVSGVWAGSRLFEIIPKQNYRRATLLLLFAAGVAALIR